MQNKSALKFYLDQASLDVHLRMCSYCDLSLLLIDTYRQLQKSSPQFQLGQILKWVFQFAYTEGQLISACLHYLQ